MPSRRPVIITHPGCDVEALKCGTCAHAREADPDDAEAWCQLGIDDGDENPLRAEFFCALWTCRACGGEVDR